MEDLPESHALRELYPEDLYGKGMFTGPGDLSGTHSSLGGYYPSPFGRVKYWIVGPESGKKV